MIARVQIVAWVTVGAPCGICACCTAIYSILTARWVAYTEDSCKGDQEHDEPWDRQRLIWREDHALLSLKWGKYYNIILWKIEYIN